MTWLFVLVGGAIGAPLRFLVDRAVQARHDTVFPWGTFSANVAACTLLGFMAGLALSTTVPSSLQLLVGTGVCGALSTYSTFSFETLRLAETGSKYFALANAGISVVVGLGAALLGTALGTAVVS